MRINTLKFSIIVPFYAFILILSLVFSTFCLAASTQKPGTGINAVQDVSERKSTSRQKPLLPDLVVTRVDMTTDCRLKFTVQNNSRAAMTPSTHAKGELKIEIIGKPNRTIVLPFSEADPKGSLEKPFGKFTTTSKIKLSGHSYITLTIDPNNRIPESKETNNRSQKTRFKASCDSLKKPRLLPQTGEKPQRATSRRVKPEARKRPGAEASTIVVSEIKEDKGSVIVTLKREGNKPVEPSVGTMLKLAVDAGKRRNIWPLTTIDPGFRRLNHIKGTLKFDSGIRLEKPTLVTAFIRGSIPEKKRTVKLVPQDHHEKGRPKLLPGESAGITVTAPMQGSYHLRGRQLAIAWKADPAQCSVTGNYRVNILRAGSSLNFPLDGPITRIMGRGFVMNTVIPSSTPGGDDYYIGVSQDGDSCQGWSQTFSVLDNIPDAGGSGDNAATPAISVRSPARYDTVYSGRVLNIQWTVEPSRIRTLVGWNIQILRNGIPISDTAYRMEFTDSNRPLFNNTTRIYSTDWPVPDNANTDGIYTVRVSTTDHPSPSEHGVGSELTGRSDEFTIMALGGGYEPDLSDECDIHITSPNHATVAYLGLPYNIQWRKERIPPSARLNISLYKNGTWYHDIRHNVHSNVSGFFWTVGEGVFHQGHNVMRVPDPGSNYQIHISTTDSEIDCRDTSASFSIENTASGSYQDTCRNIRLSADGTAIMAECRTSHGSWMPTYLNNFRECLDDISNNEGHLNCRSNLTWNGSFEDSCRDIAFWRYEGRFRITARCRKMNGLYNNTYLDHPDRCFGHISNNDGNLECPR